MVIIESRQQTKKEIYQIRLRCAASHKFVLLNKKSIMAAELRGGELLYYWTSPNSQLIYNKVLFAGESCDFAEKYYVIPAQNEFVVFNGVVTEII